MTSTKHQDCVRLGKIWGDITDKVKYFLRCCTNSCNGNKYKPGPSCSRSGYHYRLFTVPYFVVRLSRYSASYHKMAAILIFKCTFSNSSLPLKPPPPPKQTVMRRWQPVTQSARSRQSCGQIEDCEQSNSTIHRINLCPVVSAIGFPNSYPLDSVIYLLNNWGVMISNKVSVTLCIMVKVSALLLFVYWLG